MVRRDKEGGARGLMTPTPPHLGRACAALPAAATGLATLASQLASATLWPTASWLAPPITPLPSLGVALEAAIFVGQERSEWKGWESVGRSTGKEMNRVC